MSSTTKTQLGSGRRNLSQVVADELMRRIEEGQFAVGERAPTEKQLMEMFAVGRSTAREAVGVLVAAGILDVRPGRGPVVLRRTGAGPDPMDPHALSALLDDRSLAQLYEFRLLIETECASSAALRAEEEDLTQIQSLLRELRHAVKNEQPTHELDVRFHIAIARASHNEIFVDVLEAVSERLSGARAITDAVPGAREVAVLGHSDVYNAIASHDPDAARAAMRDHVLTGLLALEEAHGINAGWLGRDREAGE